MLLFLLISTLGFGFFGVLPRSINSTLRLLVCPAIGLLLFAEFVLLYSFIFNVGIASILAGLFSEGGLAFVAFKIFKPQVKFEKVSALFMATLVTICAISSYIYYFQLLYPTPSGSLQTGGGGLYGDTALHSAYTSRIQTGEFPPQNPLFAGKALVYPLANDLLSAILRINGLAINWAFILPQITFLVAFLALFYSFSRKFTTDRGFLIAACLFSLGWGIGFVYFLQEFLARGSWLLISDFTNNPQYNLHLHNVFTGLIFPERSFLPGLILALWIFLNFWEYFQTRKKIFLVISSILFGILPFWHVHAFIFVFISSLVFAFFLLFKHTQENIREFLILPLISFLFALPFLVLFFTNHPEGSFLRFSAGWENESENIVIFWLKNSFLILPLAALGLWKLKRDLRFFFIGPVIAFSLANIVIFQPWSWDNIKLLTLSFLFFAILAGSFLNNILERGLVLKTSVMIVILVSCLSGFLSILLQLNRTFVIYDKDDIELAGWAKNNTQLNDVFLIDPTPTHPIPGLSGRLVYVGYPGHLWVHGIDYGKREQMTNQILAGDFSQIDNLEVPVSYVVLSKNNRNLEIPKEFNKVYQNQKYLVLENTTD